MEAISKSRAHHTKQLYFAGLMHKLHDIQNLLLMFITLHLRNAASLASVKMAGLPDLFLSETYTHSQNWSIILVIAELLGTAESSYSR
jgi:hypothetical protein